MKKTLIAGVLSLLIASVFAIAPTSAQNKSTISAGQKAQLLNIVNTMRAGHKQKPLGLRLETQTVFSQTSKTSSSGGVISGRFYSEDGSFHHIGYVTAWSANPDDNSGVVMETVHPEGYYFLENLNSGDYYVLAIAEEFVPMFYDNAFSFNEASLVPVADGDIVEGIDFKMQRTIPGEGSISGSVSGEFTDNTIAGVSITVWSPDNRYFYGSATTDENGSYKISGLKSGDYYASAYKEGYITEFYENAQTFSDAKTITVNEPEETSGINFTLSEGGRISGRVTDEDGEGIANANIQASPVFWYFEPDSITLDSSFVNSRGSVITDENGHYTVTGLQTGDYFVTAYMITPTGQSYFEYYDGVHSIDQATPVNVVVEQETEGIDFVLPPNNFNGEVKGIVKDLNGNPLQNAYINLVVADDSSFAIWARIPYGRTDENGEYHIQNIPYGDYYVMASYNEQWQSIQRWWPDAESQEGAEVVPFDKEDHKKTLHFTLPLVGAVGVISGQVKDTNGEPLAYAFVEVVTASDVLNETGDVIAQIWAYANTDSNGFYQVIGLPQGEYTASAQYWLDDNFGQQWYDHKDSFDEANRILLAEDDTLNNINFDLDVRPYYGSITGFVTDEETGEPIDRAYIEITPTDFQLYYRPFYNWTYYAVTRDNGEYSLDWLPSGEYIVSVYTNGAFEYYEGAYAPENATMVDVIGGEKTEVSFGLTKKDDGSGIIRGRVYDEYNDGFLEIAIVKATPIQTDLTDPNPAAVYTAVIDEQGNYEITGLPQGGFIVYAYSPNHIGEYYDSVYDPSEAKVIAIEDNGLEISGVDFSLQPAYYLAVDYRNLEGAPSTVNATVSGQVSDENGTAIAEAFVYLMDETGVPVAFARSNAQGHYELSNIGQGRYKIKATHIGFNSTYNGDASSFESAQSLEIANGLYQVNLKLKPGTVTSIDGVETSLPETVQLYGNYPNPFNPTTQITFGLPEEMLVKLSIYNLLGQRINELYSGKLTAGKHTLNWNGRDYSGQFVPSGIYFSVLQTGANQLLVRQMTLLK